MSKFCHNSKLLDVWDRTSLQVNIFYVLGKRDLVINILLYSGRMKKSPVVSELLYSLTNIIVFVNDQILIKAHKASRENPIPNEFVDKSRVILTLLEYLQVFLELTASRLWGSIGKWTVIVAIQTVKYVQLPH